MQIAELIWRDLRYAGRLITQRPTYALGIIFTLALVTGASTAIFSTLYELALHRLPYPDPGRLVAIWESNRETGADHTTVAEGAFPILANVGRSFEGVGACDGGRDRPAATNELTADRLWSTDATVFIEGCSSRMFQLLGVQPILGRGFLPEEDLYRENSTGLAILSYGFWREHYGMNPDVLGTTFAVNSFGEKQEYRIIGVMPSDFEYPYPFSSVKPDFWVNFNGISSNFSSGTHLDVIARLKPGVSLNQARAELDEISSTIRKDQPKRFKDKYLHAGSLADELVRDARIVLVTLLIALGFVLLVGCANIGALLLAQAQRRRKELAVRAALGAGRAALLRLMLVETLTLAIAGGLLGLALAFAGLRLLSASLPASIYIPRFSGVPLDYRVLGAAMGLAILTALVFTVWPALRHSRPDVIEELKSGGSSGRRAGQILRPGALLLACQVALAFALIAGATLLTRSLRRFLETNDNFEPEHFMTMDVEFSNAFVSRSEHFGGIAASLYAQLEERAKAMPGVKGVAFVDQFPLYSLQNYPNGFKETGGEGAISEGFQPAEMHVVSASYFALAHCDLVRGRWFSDEDQRNTNPVAVINTEMARRYWPSRDPIGARIEPFGRITDKQLYSVVGVIEEPPRFGTGLKADPAVFLSVDQIRLNYRSVLIRTTGNPRALIVPLREAALAMAPADVTVGNVQTGNDMVSLSSARMRFTGLLLTCFSGLALLLALVGIYGLVSYATTRRTREIGIRMALGASPDRIKRMLLIETGFQAGAGILAGLGLAYLFSKSLQAMLYGISPVDPVSLLTAALAIASVALAACYVPTWRAARVDPLVALRHE